MQETFIVWVYLTVLCCCCCFWGNITLWLCVWVCVYVDVYNYFVCVRFQASLSVCVFAVVLSGHLLLELLIPPPQVLCSCCALICWYTWSVISLYAYSACCREILTLSMRRSLLLNTSRAFTYQVSDVKGKFISAFTPRWCGNCTPLGQRLGEEALKKERTEWAARRWSWPSHFDAYVAQKYWPGL